MEFFGVILTVALVHFLAVVSPGPDFIMVTRNSLVYSRKAGVFTAIGLGFGILVHIIYSLIGVGVLISQSIVLFSIVKYVGALYLIYIGVKSLVAKKSNLTLQNQPKLREISRVEAIEMGFLTNATNPKATLFFLSLFTLLIEPTTPVLVKLFMSAEMFLVTVLWFMFVAFVISHQLIKSKLDKIRHLVERFVGVVLIALGIKLALSTSK